ncbi:hypothetical protein UPYG_G00283020 [Umbra pygmaea]|uniref:RUN domain-containing protein n=1 Tax=Umbra pygmaea TaxID=75934 RepID=A0ABD0W543_UMBPY
MNRTASLSGDTLVACHFPLVQLSPWQLPVQAALCSSSVKQPGRLCSSSVSLTRAASLPEQDALREPFHSSLGHTSSSYWSLKEDRGEEDGDGDMGSVSSGRCDSGSSPDETSQMIAYQRHPDQAEGKGTSDQPEVKGTLRSHNSFLPSEELDDGDSDGDNLHGYHEDASYVLQLHGNSNWALGNDGRRTATPCTPAGQQNHGTWGGNVRMDCEQEKLEDVEDNMLKCGDEGYCFSYGQGECLRDSFSDGHLENVTDSSCNSSDGVLVNFSAIYDRSNNPASPNNLSAPAAQSSQPAGGSVLLNLHPQETQGPQAADFSQGVRTTFSPHGRTPSSSDSSSHTLDSNCNVYLPDAEGMLSSLEVSDITSCLQARQLPTGTTQKYYKLVTCDLSSRSASPSPAWSSTTSVTSEGHYFLFSKALGEQGEVLQEEGFDKEGRRATPLPRPRSRTWDSSATEPPHSKANKPCCQSSSHSNTSLDLGPIQEALSLGSSGSCYPLLPHPKQQSSNVSHCNAVSVDLGAVEEGACSWALPVVRYSKAQRPTSLPIQPFILLPPACQSQNQPLGSLLDRYISQKHTKPSSSSHLGSKCKDKVNRLPAHLRPSPLGSYGPNLLEGASSSETCSTCTPSPERFPSSRSWTHYSPYNSNTSPELNPISPKQATITTKPLYAKLTQGHSCQGRLYAQEQRYTNPGQSYRNPNQFQQKDSIRRSQGMAQICQDLIRLSPEERTHNPLCPTSPHVPPMSPPASHPCQPDLLSCSPGLALPPHHRTPLSPVTLTSSASSHWSLAAAFSSVAPLPSLSSLLQPLMSVSVKQHHPLHPLVGSRVKQQQRLPEPSDSFSLSDSKPPAEFCLSPDASYESLSISDLQRRGLLRSVSLAVDLIMTHFGTSRDPGEKTRLGNSSRSPTIGGLVLEHLCPTIQNILQDGLRDHRLDLVIGQRRNHAWIVVEACTQTGPTTRVLHSLLCKVRQCPLLANHSMRLRAFIMGLLNLRALEFWLNHLYNQKDVVAAHYHSWGFLAMSEGQCQPLFHELLLLLQPLSMLPFDLNLLLEPRLLHNRQLCSEESSSTCSTFLMSSWPLLRADRLGPRGSDPHLLVQHVPGPAQATKPMGLERARPVGESSCGLQAGSSSGWCQRQPAYSEWLVEGVECNQIDMDVIHSEPHPRMEARKEDSSQGARISGVMTGTTRVETDIENKSPSHCRLRWAKLFGSGGDASTRTQRASQNPNGSQFQKRRPSEWLHLDRSQLGMLAQTLWSGKLPGDWKQLPKTWVLR